MGSAVPLRGDYTANEIRRLARQYSDNRQIRRLLTLAAVYDGMNRTEAARIGGMDRQTLRDWVHHFNEFGPDGLTNAKGAGRPRSLTNDQMQELTRIVEAGPDPQIDGVTRWRCIDLVRVIAERFGVVCSERSMGDYLAELGFSNISGRPSIQTIGHPEQDTRVIEAVKKTSPTPRQSLERRVDSLFWNCVNHGQPRINEVAMNSTALLDHFSALEDPRQPWKVVYPLREVLLTVLCGTIAGADDFVEVALWAQEKINFLRRLLPFENGVASHDTLNDVMNALPSQLFADCFTSWVADLRDDAPDIVSIDGKTSRRAHGKKGTDDGRPLHLVSAWACRQRLVLGQEACDEKENEISAIPRLLKRLELRGALVTIDAMGCQHGIAQTIRDQQADYLLALKSNQKSLHSEVALFFDIGRELEQHTTVDADHGRIEKRTTTVCHAVDWLTNQRKAPGEPKFPNLAAIAMVEAQVEEGGKITRSKRYYISSAPLTAKQLGRAVREHWGIENRLHWVMDVVFHDDLMRLRTKNGPQNMATIRHTALNIIKTIPGKESLKVKRKSTAWNEDKLMAAITNKHQ